MPKHLLKLGAALIAAVLVTGAVAAQNAAFTFTTIDVPGSIQTNANGINSRGQIVGFYTDVSSGTSHGFLDDNGTLTTLDFPGAINNAAFGINKDGQIVGWYAGAQHAFFYDQSMFTVPDPPQSDPFRLATRINDTLQIVGSYSNQSGRHGFLYDRSTFTIIDVPFPGALHTQAFGINNHGQIVGIYVKPNGEYGGFLYENGTFTPIDVTLPGAHNTTAYDINDMGQIVGWYQDPSFVVHGFVYQNGVYTSIDVPGSTNTEVIGINKQGAIVGKYLKQGAIVGKYLDVRNAEHGFLAKPTGK